MRDLRFQGDETKNTANQNKQGVSFQEARSVFYDDRAVLISDPDGSRDEDRFLLLGLSGSLRTLVVCHCYRQRDSVIRIISARRAERTERLSYEGRSKK